MRRTQRAGHLAAVAAVALALAGCAQSDGTQPTDSDGDVVAYDGEEVTITFTWWGNDDRANRYTEALALFNEEYPNITVNTSWASFNDYNTARNTEAAGSALPDVMQFDSAYLREYAGNDRLLDLMPYIDAGAIDTSGFEATILEGGQLDGEQVAIPIATNAMSFVVNPQVEELAGLTFPTGDYSIEELNDYLLDVHAVGATTEDGYGVYGGHDYTATFWSFLYYQIQLGNEPFTEDGQLGFTQDDIVAWLDFGEQIRTEGAVYPADRVTSVAPMDGTTMGEAVSIPVFSSQLAGLEADAGADNFTLAPMFTIEGQEQKNFFRPSMHLTVAANSDQPAAAAVLVNFLLTSPEVAQIFGTSLGVPADQEQREALVVEPGSADERVLAYHEAIAQTDVVPAPIPVEGFGTIYEKWRTLGEELDYGYITPEEFAADWWAEAELAVG